MKLQIKSHQLQTVWNLMLEIWCLFMIGYLVFGIPSAGAQVQPELMLTWKASSYVPPDYPGKVLPTAGSRIDLGIELIDNNRLANISNREIRWSVDGGLRESGIGLKSFSFVTGPFGGETDVEITVVGYRGSDVQKMITIPIASPEVVITGGPNIFQALLYFFNIQNISQAKFTWSSNGKETSGQVENPDFVTLNTGGLPAGTEFSISLQVQNLLKPLEIATKSINVVAK